MKRLRTFIATGAVLAAFAVPAAAAQSPAVAQMVQHPRLALARIVGGFLGRIRQGVRANQITPQERAQLRLELVALRTTVRTIRQSGAPPSTEQKAAVRAQLRHINRDIYLARHGELAR